MRSQTTAILSGRWPGGLEQGFYGREVEDAQGKTRKPLLVSKTPEAYCPKWNVVAMCRGGMAVPINYKL